MKLRGVIFVALAVLLIYGVFRAYPLLRGPGITIDVPSEGTTSPAGFILLSGTAHHTETLWLNGGALLIDDKGHFSKELLLPAGASTLYLSARDRFGRTTSENRTVFVPGTAAPVATSTGTTTPLRPTSTH